MLRTVKIILGLAPAPLFFCLAVVSYVNSDHICGFTLGLSEMTWMWLVMSIAHLLPWIAYYEQRQYRRYSHAEWPVKQQ